MILAFAKDCNWLNQTSLPSRNRQQPPLDACPELRQQGLGSRNLLLKGSQVCIFWVRI